MLRIAFALMKTSLQAALQYRSDFLFAGVTGLLRTAAAVAPLVLVALHTDHVRDWTVPEAMLVMALFLVLVALQGAIMEANLGEVVEAVRTGNLDLWLIKPADAQLLVSLRRIDPTHLWDLLAALVIGAWAVSRIPPPGVSDVAVAAVLFLCGLCAIYGLWILAICLSFHFVRVDNLRFLLISVADAGRLPLSVFPPAIRFVLTTIVPVALITSYPATALRGVWGVETVAVGVAMAFISLAVSRWAWTRSLARYTSASS